MKLISLVKIYAGGVIGEFQHRLFWCWGRRKSVTSESPRLRAANTEILTHGSIIICLHPVCGTEYITAMCRFHAFLAKPSCTQTWALSFSTTSFVTSQAHQMWCPSKACWGNTTLDFLYLNFQIYYSSWQSHEMDFKLLDFQKLRNTDFTAIIMCISFYWDFSLSF